MEILGYTVSDFKLIADGKGGLVKAERPCDCCLGSDANVIKVSLDGYPAPWKEALVCKNCLVKGGMFLDIADLDEEIQEMGGGRGRG